MTINPRSEFAGSISMMTYARSWVGIAALTRDLVKAAMVEYGQRTALGSGGIEKAAHGRRYAVYLAGCASRPERCAVHGGPGYLARAAQRCETVSLSRPGYHFGASAAERRLRAQSELAGLCDDRARRHPPTRWGRLLTLAARFRWDPRGRLELPGWWVAGSVPQDKRRGKVSRGVYLQPARPIRCASCGPMPCPRRK